MKDAAQTSTVLRISRVLPAPKKTVYRAWTNPEELDKWWKLGEDWQLSDATVDLRVGGHFRIKLKSTSEDAAHSVRGVYREVVPEEKLVYTWIVENPSGHEYETLVTAEFRNQQGSTELVLTHELLDEKSLRDNVRAGWTLVLAGLERLIASSAT